LVVLLDLLEVRECNLGNEWAIGPLVIRIVLITVEVAMPASLGDCYHDVWVPLQVLDRRVLKKSDWVVSGQKREGRSLDVWDEHVLRHIPVEAMHAGKLADFRSDFIVKAKDSFGFTCFGSDRTQVRLELLLDQVPPL